MVDQLVHHRDQLQQHLGGKTGYCWHKGVLKHHCVAVGRHRLELLGSEAFSLPEIFKPVKPSSQVGKQGVKGLIDYEI